MKYRRQFAAALILIVSVAATQAQEATVREHYTKEEHEIVMRDGVKLFTSIYIPKDKSKTYPFLMMRTPYSVSPYGKDAYRSSLGPSSDEFIKAGYIFVYQDVRGRYRSEGDFKWMTPFIPNKTGKQTDESTDTRDTVDWLLKNVANNNGRVGLYGTSFPGHYAAQALLDPHPAVKAVSPQAPMADNWIGDDMHHNGAFFLPHAMNFIAGFGKARTGPTESYGERVFQHGTPDGYRFFLEMGPLSNANKLYLKDQIKIWNEWMLHGDYDGYWQAQNVPQHMKRVTPAVMTVGGWWDAEDLYGPLVIYRAIEKNNPRAENTLVMGPWYHGSWNRGAGDALHDIRWNTKTGEVYRTQLQLPFFEKYLKDSPNINIPEAMMFDVGADQWRQFDAWPPKTMKPGQIYLGGGEKLTMEAPTGGGDFDEYINDPRRPVPNSATVTTGMARSYMIEDQRFVWSRPDVLSYETPVLESDMTVGGPLKATLFISTTGSDADYIVKLIDVFPNDAPNNSPRGDEVQMGGYQMMIRGEPMRAKYRNSWSKPEPLTPNKVEKVEFVLPDVLYTFKKGHKVMVQIHSSWFPLIDRNPQKFVNIFQAKPEDFQKATHKIYHTKQYPSGLSWGIIQQ